jgi:hypothetical protein
MRTKTISIYSFSELSEESQQKALNNLSSINVDFDWWDGIYNDAKNIGLTITGFGLDRNKHATGDFKDAFEAATKIMKEHGENCDTYKLASEFLLDRDKLVEKYSDGVTTSIVSEDNEYQFDQECDELEEEFERALLEEYASILQNEYEYQTSDESIQETIEANEYEFDDEGNLI